MDFKEFEREQAGKPAEMKQEAQDVKDVQEPLTPEEIDKVGEDLHQAALWARNVFDPNANLSAARSFAHAPFFRDYVEEMADVNLWTPEFKASVGDLEKFLRMAKKAQAVVDQWQGIKERFFASDQWQMLKEAFPDITEEQGETLLDIPAFTWQVIDALPEIKQEIQEYEASMIYHFTFNELLLQNAGHMPDASDPREMILSVFLTRATKKKASAAEQISGKPSKYHVVPINALSNAIRSGLVGSGPQNILLRKKDNLTANSQLYFNQDGEIINPAEARPAGQEEPENFILSAEIRDIIKIDGQHTGADDANREAIYTKIMNAKEAGISWKDLQFTATTIWQEKNHTTKRPSEQAKKAIIRSIEKQRHLMADLDLTPYEKMGIVFHNQETGLRTTTYNDHFLKLGKGTDEKGNEYYQLTGYPIELSIAERMNQLIKYPASLLEIHEVTSKGEITDTIVDTTEERTAIARSLCRIVYNMKYQLKKAHDTWRRNESRRQKKISKGEPAEDPRTAESYLPALYKEHFRFLFDTLFRDSGIDTTNRAQLQRHREFVYLVLDNFKAYKYQGEPVIKNYEIVKGGRGGKVQGVDIIF